MKTKIYLAILGLTLAILPVAEAQSLGHVCYDTTTGRIASFTRRCGRGYSELSESRIKRLVIGKGETGDRGPRGERGLPGAKGLTGAKGATGLGAFDKIPASKTITGVIGGLITSTSSVAGDVAAWSKTESIAGVIPSGITSTEVIVAYNGLFTQCNSSAPNRARYNCMNAADSSEASLCTGSVENPTAPRGKICIYVYSLSNAYNVEGKAAANTKAGFELTWVSVPTESATTDLRAVWAYTAN